MHDLETIVKMNEAKQPILSELKTRVLIDCMESCIKEKKCYTSTKSILYHRAIDGDLTAFQFLVQHLK